MEVIAHFGERADFSPDNQRTAFMAKSFGDVCSPSTWKRASSAAWRAAFPEPRSCGPRISWMATTFSLAPNGSGIRLV